MTDKKVTVYSKPNCMQCTFVKRFLNDNNVSFTEIDATSDEEHLDYLRSLNFKSLPVTFIEGEEAFSGFNPDKLNALIQE